MATVLAYRTEAWDFLIAGGGLFNNLDYSFAAGYENGTFDSGIVWSNGAPTPYHFYRGVMSTETVKPAGEQTFENYHRFGSAEADALLAAFAEASDEAAQRSIVNDLQALFLPGPDFDQDSGQDRGQAVSAAR